jgi:hypothetical protein
MTKAMRLLIDAQRESDAAKKIYELGHAKSIKQGSKMQHYYRKYIDELRLIRLLSTTKNPEMSYYVCKDLDQSGCPSYIVYFEFSLNGRKYQISFHNPYPMCRALREYVGKGTKTEWDGDVGGSRNAAREALRSF